MFSSDLKVPALALASASVIAISAYLIAPEIGRRHLNVSGAVQHCETRIANFAQSQREAAESAKDTAQIPNFNTGAIVGAVFGDRPNADEFRERFGKHLEKINEAISVPVIAALKEKRDAAQRFGQAIDARFQETAAVGETACACRARSAINIGRTNLAIFTATGGFVKLPPADDWRAALTAPSVIEFCRGGLP